MAQKKKGKIGSSFDGFLAEGGILEACEEQAVKQLLADQTKAAMEKDRLTKSAMASRMQTSRRALDRLLDPKNTGVTLQRAAAAVGRHDYSRPARLSRLRSSMTGCGAVYLKRTRKINDNVRLLTVS